MYPIIRRIHLFTGLLTLAFVLMYFATGFVLVREDWFPAAEPVAQKRTEKLTTDTTPGSPAYIDYLEKAFQLRGQRAAPKKNRDGSWEYGWFHPGEQQQVKVSANGGEAVITHKDLGSVRVIRGMHRLHGYGGGLLYDAWALLLDLSSLAIIGFAVSGVYLWYQTTQKRAAGWACLAISFGLAGATLLYFGFAR